MQQKEAKKTNFCVTLFRLQKMKNSKKKIEKMKISIRMKTENGLITLSGSAKKWGWGNSSNF